jgi:phospholipid transport system substrate-binding protein
MAVHASIERASGAAVPLEYVLHEAADGWRIVNIVADGVSDLALKRAEYQRLFGSGGFAALVAELDAQISRLRSSDQPR